MYNKKKRPLALRQQNQVAESAVLMVTADD